MPEVLTIAEVAKVMKLNPATIRKIAREGHKGFFKVGPEWRITEDDLNIWIKELKEQRQKELSNHE